MRKLTQLFVASMKPPFGFLLLLASQIELCPKLIVLHRQFRELSLPVVLERQFGQETLLLLPRSRPQFQFIVGGWRHIRGPRSVIEDSSTRPAAHCRGRLSRCRTPVKGTLTLTLQARWCRNKKVF